MTKEGIPHSLRPHMWMRISGAYEKKIKSDLTYKDVVKASSNDHLMTSKQIEKVHVMFLIIYFVCHNYILDVKSNYIKSCVYICFVRGTDGLVDIGV